MSFLVLAKQDSSGSAYNMWSNSDEWVEYGRSLIKMLKPGYKKTADNLWEHLGQDLQDMLRVSIGLEADSESVRFLHKGDVYEERRRRLLDLDLIIETSLRGKWGYLVCTKAGYVLWELVTGQEGKSATERRW